jgi:hypothetical protein
MRLGRLCITSFRLRTPPCKWRCDHEIRLCAYRRLVVDRCRGRGLHPVRTPKPTQVSIAAASQAVVGGQAHLRAGYLAVLVDIDEIRAKVRGHDPGGLTRRPASKRLRTQEKVIHALIKAGKLTTFVARDPINRCPQVLISHEEMDRFCREYVSLFLLAEERGKHFRRMLKELNAQGIEPTLDPERIGARFYARRDVMPDSQ